MSKAFPLLLSTALWALLASGGCDSQLEVQPIQRQAPAVGPEPVLVTNVDPPQDAVDVDPSAGVAITFSRVLRDLVDLGDRPIRLTLQPQGTPIDGAVALEGEGTRLVFRPAAPLATPFARYRIDIDPAVVAADGGAVDREGSPATLPTEFTTTGQVDRGPPVFGGITGLEALSSSSMRASWTVPAADDTTAERDIVYRAYLGKVVPPATVDDCVVDFSAVPPASDPGALETIITGLDPDTFYCVTVRASDALGNEDRNTAVLTRKTLADVDTEPPFYAPEVEPGGIASIQPLSTTALRVFWKQAADNRTAGGDLRYRVYIATVAGGIRFDQPPAATFQGVTEGDLTGLVQDREYFAAVRAVDTSGNEETNDRVLSARTLASYAAVLVPVLRASCSLSGCHNAGSRAAGLDTSTYNALIAGGRTKNPNTIVPGNGAGSLFIWRCDARSPNFRTDIPGWRMPRNRAALPTATLDAIRRWIDQGALNN